MKAIVFAALFFASTLVTASGRIPFLFAPRIPTVVATPLATLVFLNFGTFDLMDGDTIDFVGTTSYSQVTAEEVRSMALRNDGAGPSGIITLSMQAHNGAFIIQNDNCSGSFLLVGGSCTFEIYFNGVQPSPSAVRLDALQDSTPTVRKIYMQYCPGC